MEMMEGTFSSNLTPVFDHPAFFTSTQNRHEAAIDSLDFDIDIDTFLDQEGMSGLTLGSSNQSSHAFFSEHSPTPGGTTAYGPQVLPQSIPSMYHASQNQFFPRQPSSPLYPESSYPFAYPQPQAMPPTPPYYSTSPASSLPSTPRLIARRSEEAEEEEEKEKEAKSTGAKRKMTPPTPTKRRPARKTPTKQISEEVSSEDEEMDDKEKDAKEELWQYFKANAAPRAEDESRRNELVITQQPQYKPGVPFFVLSNRASMHNFSVTLPEALQNKAIRASIYVMSLKGAKTTRGTATKAKGNAAGTGRGSTKSTKKGQQSPDEPEEPEIPEERKYVEDALRQGYELKRIRTVRLNPYDQQNLKCLHCMRTGAALVFSVTKLNASNMHIFWLHFVVRAAEAPSVAYFASSLPGIVYTHSTSQREPALTHLISHRLKDCALVDTPAMLAYFSLYHRLKGYVPSAFESFPTPDERKPLCTGADVPIVLDWFVKACGVLRVCEEGDGENQERPLYLYSKGYIHGYLSRSKVIQLLRGHRAGTFLFRIGRPGLVLSTLENDNDVKSVPVAPQSPTGIEQMLSTPHLTHLLCRDGRVVAKEELGGYLPLGKKDGYVSVLSVGVPSPEQRGDAKSETEIEEEIRRKKKCCKEGQLSPMDPL